MIEPTQFFKCLSEELRLNAMLLILNEGELCVCELMEALEETQPKISRHLAQLRSCGILNDTRRGQWVFYSISNDLPIWCTLTLKAVSQDSSLQIDAFKKKLQQMGNRPTCC